LHHFFEAEVLIKILFQRLSKDLSHFTFKKTSTFFSFDAGSKKNYIAGKGKCAGLLFVFGTDSFAHLALTVMLQALVMNFMRRAKLSGGALSIKQMRFAPYACGLRLV
jgi:hypothetical protein